VLLTGRRFSPRRPNKKKEMTMWKKVLLKIALTALASVPWEKIVKAVLVKLAAKIKESGRTLDSLDPCEVLEDIEEVLNDYLGVNADLNHDGKIGDGVEG